MRAVLTIERQLPAALIERVRASVPKEELEKWHGLCVDHFYDDEDASKFLREGASSAKSELDGAAKKIGLTNEAIDIHYGFSGVRGWTAWYQRVYA